MNNSNKYKCTCGRLVLLSHNCDLTDDQMILWLQDREYSIAEKQSNLKRAAKQLANNWALSQSKHLDKILFEVSTVREQLIKNR